MIMVQRWFRKPYFLFNRITGKNQYDIVRRYPELKEREEEMLALSSTIYKRRKKNKFPNLVGYGISIIIMGYLIAKGVMLEEYIACWPLGVFWIMPRKLSITLNLASISRVIAHCPIVLSRHQLTIGNKIFITILLVQYWLEKAYNFFSCWEEKTSLADIFRKQSKLVYVLIVSYLWIKVENNLDTDLLSLTALTASAKPRYNTQVEFYFNTDLVDLLDKQTNIILENNQEKIKEYLNAHLPLIESCEMTINKKKEVELKLMMENKNYLTALLNTYAYANLIIAIEKEFLRFYKTTNKDLLHFYLEHLIICHEQMRRNRNLLNIILLLKKPLVTTFIDTQYKPLNLIKLHFSGEKSLTGTANFRVRSHLKPSVDAVLPYFSSSLFYLYNKLINKL